MRIVFFLPQLYNKGGLERTLAEKTKYLMDKGHSVLLVTFEHKGDFAYPISFGVQVADMDCHVYSLYDLPFCKRMGGFLRLKRLFRHRLSAIFQQFKPDVIVMTIPYTENFLCDLVKVAQGIPLVVECHLAYGPHYRANGQLEKLMRWFYNPFAALRKADLFLTLTEGDRRSWQQLGMPNIRVLPNPLTTDIGKFEVNSEALKEPERILFVGRLDEQKRLDRLIDAFALIAARYPAWHIDVYGNGKLRDNLQNQVDSNNLQGRVCFKGVAMNMKEIYLSSQFLVLSSDYEGFGLVIIEAMACGIPVVSTDCPYGPSEIIEDGKTGLLAKMDVQDLADKMEWMITHEDERKAMGDRAHQAVARYRKEVVMPEWEKAYLSVIGKSK